MQFSNLIAAVAIIAASVSAQTFSITNPISSTEFVAGKTVSIQWIKAGQPELANPQFIQLDLVGGDTNDLQVVAPIGSRVPGGSTSFDWQVPSNIEPGTAYSVRMIASDASGKTSLNFSARFAVSGGKADAPAPSSAAPAPTPAKATGVTPTAGTKASGSASMSATPTNIDNSTSPFMDSGVASVFQVSAALMAAVSISVALLL